VRGLRACLLAARRHRRQSFGQCGDGRLGNAVVAAEISAKQVRVDADVKIKQARTEPEFADKACARILCWFLQVIDGGIEIVLDGDPVSGKCMGDLHRRLSVEICVVGQHAAKHGDVGRSVYLRQNGVRLRIDLLPCQHLVRQSECVDDLCAAAGVTKGASTVRSMRQSVIFSAAGRAA
jgi:hypothetical protein